MLKRLFLAVCLLLFSSYAFSYEALEAVCKVHAGNVLGSGTCVDIYKDTVFVFTNYHVAGGTGKNVTCQFYDHGHESIEIPGRVVWAAFERDGNVDQAMIALDLQNFGSYRPKVIQFGDPNTELNTGDTILTVGCPEGKWPALVEGHIIKNSNGVYYIKPPVENGRSGSALIDDKTKTIVGIITWRSGDNYTGVGMAQNLQTIYGAMSNRMAYNKVSYDMLDRYWMTHKGENIFLPATRYNHLPDEKIRPFYIEIGCPNGECFPYGFGQDPNPYPNNEPPGYNGNPYPNGGRLFPTLPQNPDPGFPGQPGMPSQPQPQPQCPDISGLEDSVKSIQNSVDLLNQGINDLDGKIGELDTKQQKLTDKVAENSQQIQDLRGIVVITPGDLENNYGITPGKIEELATKDELAKLADTANINDATLNSQMQNVSEDISKINESLTAKNEEIEPVSTQNFDWSTLLINGIVFLLGGGSLGGMLAYGINLFGKSIKDAIISGVGGPQDPFQIKR